MRYKFIELASHIFFQNGKTVAKTDRVYSEVNVAFTVLINKKARRDDSGNYTLVLKNNLGSDNGACRVLVVGEFSITKHIPFWKNIISMNQFNVILYNNLEIILIH